MSDAKTWKKMRDQLRKQGCRIEQQTNTHHRIYGPDGALVTIMQCGKAGPRAVLNKRAQIRRKGFDI